MEQSKLRMFKNLHIACALLLLKSETDFFKNHIN